MKKRIKRTNEHYFGDGFTASDETPSIRTSFFEDDTIEAEFFNEIAESFISEVEKSSAEQIETVNTSALETVISAEETERFSSAENEVYNINNECQEISTTADLLETAQISEEITDTQETNVIENSQVLDAFMDLVKSDIIPESVSENAEALTEYDAGTASDVFADFMENAANNFVGNIYNVKISREACPEELKNRFQTVKPGEIAVDAGFTCSVILDKGYKNFAQKVYSLFEVKKLVALMAERVYKCSLSLDDTCESIRQAISEMLDAIILVSGLLVHRTKESILRLLGLRKAYGVVAVDRTFEQRVQNVFAELRASQFGDVIDALIQRKRVSVSKIDAFDAKMHDLLKKIENIIDEGMEYFIQHRKRCTATLGTMLGCMMIFCVTVNAGTVYTYSYHGTELGTVKDKTEISEAVSIVSENVSSDKNTGVEIKAEPDVDITYEREFSFSAVVDSYETVADKLVNCDELEGSGYAIQINGETYALVDTEETANQILETVKHHYCTVTDEEAEETDDAELADNENADDAEVLDDTAENADTDSIESENADSEAITDSVDGAASADSKDASETADAVLTGNSVEGMTSATAKADANVIRNIILANLKKENGIVANAESVVFTSSGAIDAVRMAAANSVDTSQYASVDFSEIDPTTLEGVSLENVNFEDDVVIVPVTAKVSDFKDYDTAVDYFINEDGESKVLTVSTSEIEVYPEEVAFDTVYEDTDELYENETETIVEGVDGEKRVTAYVTKQNSEEIGREILDETITVEPVSEVVLRGTKEKPSWVASGTFINPASGRLSSKFGQRWGRSHNGIDIAGASGSNILAADGGTVVFASYNSGGYGNLVKVDHGNGTQTWYAHNTSLCVSVGDKVYQGQVIAKMGNTGRSTGTHCHFEIRINGTPVNPLNYVNY